MLDASVVISKGYGGPLTLSSGRPETIIDGGDAGATVKVISGTVETALIGNDYVLTTAWSPVASGGSVVIPAGRRTVVKDAGSPRAGRCSALRCGRERRRAAGQVVRRRRPGRRR
jgi:hypothetical protein